MGKMAIAAALPGFNDLGRSVTPTFLCRNGFYSQLSPHCPKMNKKSMCEVKKKSRFLSTGHRIQVFSTLPKVASAYQMLTRENEVEIMVS